LLTKEQRTLNQTQDEKKDKRFVEKTTTTSKRKTTHKAETKEAQPVVDVSVLTMEELSRAVERVRQEQEKKRASDMQQLESRISSLSNPQLADFLKQLESERETRKGKTKADDKPKRLTTKRKHIEEEEEEEDADDESCSRDSSSE
jgi:hypothetical protein